MRILVVHNNYQLRGGEDSVVESEVKLLENNGFSVFTYTRSNDDVNHMTKTEVGLQTIWSRRTSRDLSSIIASFRPDIIHAHNTFPLVSPSLYWVAAKHGVPVVQTLHNFRLLCLNALFLREGRICTDCSGRMPWLGMLRGCYRGSQMASAATGGMLIAHRAIGTYRKKVELFIALNDFCRDQFIKGGLPADRVVVKPNFVEGGARCDQGRSGVLFVGRLSVEKGIATLAHALSMAPSIKCRVAGEGLEGHLLDGCPGVERVGLLSSSGIRLEMEKARVLVVPSIWFENFPRTIVEAFAAGLPVIASRIGALADIVCDGHNGLLFEPGNGADLAAKLSWAEGHPDEMARMGCRARKDFEDKYSPEVNLNALKDIYARALCMKEGGLDG